MQLNSTKNKLKNLWTDTQDNQTSIVKLKRLTVKLHPSTFTKKITEISILEKYRVPLSSEGVAG